MLKKQNKTKFEKAKNNCFCGAKTTLIYSLIEPCFYKNIKSQDHVIFSPFLCILLPRTYLQKYLQNKSIFPTALYFHLIVQNFLQIFVNLVSQKSEKYRGQQLLRAWHKFFPSFQTFRLLLLSLKYGTHKRTLHLDLKSESSIEFKISYIMNEMLVCSSWTKNYIHICTLVFY